MKKEEVYLAAVLYHECVRREKFGEALVILGVVGQRIIRFLDDTRINCDDLTARTAHLKTLGAFVWMLSANGRGIVWPRGKDGGHG